jgi:hypothetical protein
MGDSGSGLLETQPKGAKYHVPSPARPADNDLLLGFSLVHKGCG